MAVVAPKRRWAKRAALVPSWGDVFAVLLLLAALPFALYAARFGVDGLTQDLTGRTYLFVRGDRFGNTAVFVHMVAGGLITAMAPLQVLGVVRRRAPALHRWSGYLLATAALISALSGLAFIAARGTIGGAHMDVAFGVYGVLLGVAAVQTVRWARARDVVRHREWALRLFVLAIGSWIYRVHYTIWAIVADGAGTAPDFSGPFDQIQLWAFFAPYLLGLELWLRRRPAVDG